MSGGGGTISTSEPRLGALNVQQSSYGLALPIIYGRTRVGGNLIWYGDFVAIAHTTTTSSGGKGGGGGGVTQQTTTYTYEAAIMMALCEGPIGGVVSIWQAKKRFEATDTQSAIEQPGLSLANGMPSQATWTHLSDKHAAQALGYSSTAHLHSAAFSLGNNAEIDDHSFEIDAKLKFGNGVIDASPKDIVYDLLTNPQYGAAFPLESMGDLSIYGAYCQAMGLFLSPAFTEQQEAREHLKLLTSMTNSACVWSEGKLKLVPYGDESITGNGATYTPNLTPIYDLTDDDYIVTGAEDPVKCDRKTPADAYNQVQVEYLNRANAYNIEIAEAKDQANIEKFGLRPHDPIKMHAICDATVARRAAQLQLQRSLYVRNEYEFRLGWQYCLLEPMDLVTLTDEGLGLDRTPVRIIDVQEDADGLLTLRAEDYPFGVASATLYPTQSGSGFAADYNAAPANVSTPVFFEPPIELATATGLEVWCAVSGSAGSTGASWGGCHVWASLDGSTYKQVGTVRGGARYGTLTASLSSGATTMAVSLAGRGGQMLTGTAQDAQLLNTLCWVGTEAGGEYMAHTTATLTAANAYTLDGLVRGAYTTPIAAHAAGQQFVRVDGAIAKSDPLNISMIGQPIFFKFCSFNAYGGGLQALADVDAYQYTPTGSMLKLPPSNVTGLSIQIEGNGVRLTWNACPDVDYASTIVRVGTSWAAGTEVANKFATSHLLGWQPAGLLTIWVVHVDQFANQSATPASTSITIAAPQQVNINRSDVQVNTVALGWQDAKTSQPIKSYSIYTGNAGDALSACTLYGKAGSDSRSDVVIFRGAGAKRIYLIAEDLAGNTSTPSSMDVNVTLPTNFVLASEWDTSWSGAKVNAYVEDSALYLPVNVTESWSQHFANNGWATTDAQVASGHPLAFEPGMTSGSYQEQHDIGKVIPSAKVSVTTQSTTLVGSVLPSVLIEWSTDNSVWTAAPADVTEAQAAQVRYVRVTYSVTSSGFDDLVKLTRVHVTVASEEKTEYGTLTLNAADTAGTLYTCTKTFLDVVSAIATPNASPNIARLNVIVDDSTNVSKVYVQAWDGSSNRTGGQVSLQIGGY